MAANSEHLSPEDQDELLQTTLIEHIMDPDNDKRWANQRGKRNQSGKFNNAAYCNKFIAKCDHSGLSSLSCWQKFIGPEDKRQAKIVNKRSYLRKKWKNQSSRKKRDKAEIHEMKMQLGNKFGVKIDVQQMKLSIADLYLELSMCYIDQTDIQYMKKLQSKNNVRTVRNAVTNGWQR